MNQNASPNLNRRLSIEGRNRKGHLDQVLKSQGVIPLLQNQQMPGTVNIKEQPIQSMHDMYINIIHDMWSLATFGKKKKKAPAKPPKCLNQTTNFGVPLWEQPHVEQHQAHHSGPTKSGDTWGQGIPTNPWQFPASIPYNSQPNVLNPVETSCFKGTATNHPPIKPT